MSNSAIASTPQPPYYAVIFSSQRTADDSGYAATANRMLELATGQPGFLGAESARGADGFGIIVSYWETQEAILAWRRHVEHTVAREAGWLQWYREFFLRVAKVERDYGGTLPLSSADF